MQLTGCVLEGPGRGRQTGWVVRKAAEGTITSKKIHKRQGAERWVHCMYCVPTADLGHPVLSCVSPPGHQSDDIAAQQLQGGAR